MVEEQLAQEQLEDLEYERQQHEDEVSTLIDSVMQPTKLFFLAREALIQLGRDERDVDQLLAPEFAALADTWSEAFDHWEDAQLAQTVLRTLREAE